MRVPDDIEGIGPIRTTPLLDTRPRKKLLPDIDAAISACEISDGDTVSFHHHLRNGDGVLNLVMAALARRGLRNLHLAVTSIFPIHEPLIAHIRDGVVGRISASFIAGPVGEAISRGALAEPVMLRSHGGRAWALDSGQVQVDVAFVAASAADERGNLTGRAGSAPFGTMGYPMVDVETARHVVAVTDSVVPFPLAPIDIPQHKVDYVALVDSIGDPEGIASGTLVPASDPAGLAIAERTAEVIAHSGLLEDGFAFQTGAGSISLATAAAVGQEMGRRGIGGSFVSGGISGFHVEMLRAGLFRNLMDVQCFDGAAIRSYRDDPRHLAMSASAYAGPHIGGAVVDQLSAVVLGAAEVDLDFNVNVTTKAGGILIGGSGGHADAAEGAALTMITTRLIAAGYPKIVPEVGTLTTPGSTVDVVITEAGVTVNPARADLLERLGVTDLPLIPIGELQARASAESTVPTPPRSSDRVVALSQHRDGAITDVVRQVAHDTESSER